MTTQIMIVEDDVDVAQALADVLGAAGYATLSASNGREAIEQLRAGNHPRLILLDLSMPILDGWGFRREQLRMTDAAAIPVVVVTAEGDAHTKATALGARGCLRKPCSVRALLDEVERQCGPAARDDSTRGGDIPRA